MPIKTDASLEPITVRIPAAIKLTGIGRSRLYELMRSGEIEFIKVGASTLIPVDSLKVFIARCRQSKCGNAAVGGCLLVVE